MLPKPMRRAIVAATRFAAGLGARLFTRFFPWRLLGGPCAPLPGAALRILFIRSGGIGDSIIALGALQAIAARYPGTTVDVLGAKELAAVSEGLDFIGTVIPVHRLKRLTFFRAVLRVVRLGPYHVVIDGYTPQERIGFSTALILAASRAARRVGRSSLDVGRALTDLAPPRGHGVHFVDEMFDVAALIGTATGIDRRPPLRLRTAEVVDAEATWARARGSAPRVLINIAAGHASRYWDTECFLEVAQELRRRRPSARIIVLGHGRFPDAERVAEGVGGEALVTTIRGAMALVATADLVITPDTSISHLASAFNRIVVSLHQSENYPWVPYKARGRALFSSSFYTIKFIDVATVSRAISDLLDSEPELR